MKVPGPGRRLLVAGAVVVGMAATGGAALLALMLLWPSPSVVADVNALAQVKLARVGERVVQLSVSGPHGRVAASLRSDHVWPRGRLSPGEQLIVRVTVRRSRWIGWLVGRTKTVEETVVAPVVRVATPIVRPAGGKEVSVRFTAPISSMTIAEPGKPIRRLRFLNPARVVPLGIVASGAQSAGSVAIRAAVRSWETLSPPVQVSWFPRGGKLQALVRPAPGPLTSRESIELRFSEPVSIVLGSSLPKLKPATPGRWRQIDADTIVFQPAGLGFGIGSYVVVTLPTAVSVVGALRKHPVRTLAWRVPQGSTLRLQQLLAQAGYLPVSWQSNDPGGSTSTPAAQVRAVIAPPAGSFSWRYPNAPAQLRSLWAPGQWTTMTEAAVMTFENQHDIEVDGLAGAGVWRLLMTEAMRGGDPNRAYNYVLVHRDVPQHLLLWHDGKIILQTLVNTGVPEAPTPLGTHAVFEHIPSGTMSGTNPDGSHYVDPGIPWISYFNGGEAVHGFNRGSYGFPQSVGCVELPIPTAAKVWPYTPIGTLVTISS